MPTKPTIKPQWAENDVVDPTSGQNNVAEPPASKKTDGIDREEIIPRQWQNWLQRIIYRWIDWLDGTTIPLSSDVGTSNEQKADGTGHTHALNGASQVEAEAGTDNTKVMTPLRTEQHYQKKITGTNSFSDATGVLSVDPSTLDGTGFYSVQAHPSTSQPESARQTYLCYYDSDAQISYGTSKIVVDIVGSTQDTTRIEFNNSSGEVRVLNYDANGFNAFHYIYEIKKIG